VVLYIPKFCERYVNHGYCEVGKGRVLHASQPFDLLQLPPIRYPASEFAFGLVILRWIMCSRHRAYSDN